MLIHNKDDIEFVTEFPCLLGHPVDSVVTKMKNVTSAPLSSFLHAFSLGVTTRQSVSKTTGFRIVYYKHLLFFTLCQNFLS